MSSQPFQDEDSTVAGGNVDTEMVYILQKRKTLKNSETSTMTENALEEPE